MGTSAVPHKGCPQGSMEWAVSFGSSGAGLDQTAWAGIDFGQVSVLSASGRSGGVARTAEFP